VLAACEELGIGFFPWGPWEWRYPAQIALAWLLARPWIVTIPGTRNVDHLNENFGAINVQLTSADLREIETAVSGISVRGGRMNQEEMRVVDQSA
jgi:aryl-alcohol dehydrogenase-like predicted oxidoreductase